ncbi:MAG: hypothetical protein IPP15_07130 [Saprospiraceae bacterium]|uniref:Uncharacterized protein n=1 Tax=Candidatus Opimibacter skivensis TaxID=2982028 RepID=A0A9D7STU7_9BACT|nr:hypothetical protein [Candidatus Opimibacter skivensis]MBK9982186.1 hypothetical protein [Candidatus Opimibacter skivensis]
MFYEIVELQDISGPECTIYSVIPKGSELTLFEAFVEENIKDYTFEIDDIYQRLKTIGNKFGARESFFKHFEGKPGDNVCAMFDIPNKNLRLYCIRYGMSVIILGSGGQKPKKIVSWQDDPVLRKEASYVIALAEHIGNRIVKQHDLWWSKDDMHFNGDLKNYGEEDQ